MPLNSDSFSSVNISLYDKERGLEDNKEPFDMVDAANMELNLTFISLNESVGNFTASMGIRYDQHDSQKLLFIILSLALCILNLLATQRVISHILTAVNDSQAFSNYLTIIMVGMDVYNCFVYLILAPFIGVAYYKYVLMLVFLYFFLFVGFDLRLYHLLSRMFTDRASINDVACPHTPDT